MTNPVNHDQRVLGDIYSIKVTQNREKQKNSHILEAGIFGIFV